jgi:hypothetical protein
MFIRTPGEQNIKKFFMEDIDQLLKNYKPGEPVMKQDVLKQMEKMNKQRNEMVEMNQLKQQIHMVSNYEKIIKEQKEKIDYLEKKISELIQDKISYIKTNKQNTEIKI